MLRLLLKRNGHKELTVILILKNTQIFQLESWILSTQQKELRRITDTVILLMPKLYHRKIGLKESTVMLTHKNTPSFLPENLIVLTQLREQKETTDIVTHLMHKYILNLNPSINKVTQL